MTECKWVPSKSRLDSSIALARFIHQQFTIQSLHKHRVQLTRGEFYSQMGARYLMAAAFLSLAELRNVSRPPVAAAAACKHTCIHAYLHKKRMRRYSAHRQSCNVIQPQLASPLSPSPSHCAPATVWRTW